MRRLCRSLPLLFAGLLAACEPAAPRFPLDAKQLQVQARQLSSLGAEAAVFTREVAAGHVNGSYAWVHQQALGSEVRRVAADLAQPAPVALRERQRQALVIAQDLQLALGRVADARHDAAALRSLDRQFTALRSQAQALAGTT